MNSSTNNKLPKTFSEINSEVLKKIKKDSQIYKVYIYLRDIENLTVNKSIELWGYYYLPVAISRLKKHGVNIIDINKSKEKDKIEIYAKYKLVRD